MTEPRALIGISGWRYAPWRGVFYPRGLIQADELTYAAERMTSIEVNGSFYALQRPTSWTRWREAAPDGFTFSVKGPRFITHVRRLVDVGTPLANFFASGLLGLEGALGPILWQLPPTLPFDEQLLDTFLASLPRTTSEAAVLAAAHDERLEGRSWFDVSGSSAMRYAVEVRHPSFEDARWPALLRRHGIASVTADTAGRWPFIDETTADFAYARLHGDEELYASGYDEQGLDRWEHWCRAHLGAGRDVHVYFDNDVKVRAPFDAMSLIARLA